MAGLEELEIVKAITEMSVNVLNNIVRDESMDLLLSGGLKPN